MHSRNAPLTPWFCSHFFVCSFRYARLPPRTAPRCASLRPPGMGLGVVFTDLAFESTYGGQQLVPYGSGAEARPRNDASLLRRLFVVTNVGTLLQFNYDTLDFQCVYRLHDGAITSIAVNEGFCVTASTDQFLRVWPLDFSDYWLEVRVQRDCTRAALSFFLSRCPPRAPALPPPALTRAPRLPASFRTPLSLSPRTAPPRLTTKAQ